ncbi:MAG: hypothetical protein R3F65_33525 [bacterium]
MSLARASSRPIVVDGVAYRWHVSGVSADWTQSVRIAGAARGGQRLVWVREGVSRVSDVAVTPGQVAGAIRAGRAAGWRPEEAGPAMSLVWWAPAAAAGGSVMRLRVALAPLGVRWPWRHHDAVLFGDFALDGAIDDRALGMVFAQLARAVHVPVGPREGVLAALAGSVAGAPVGARWDGALRLPAGVEVVIDGRRVVQPGCNVDAAAWVGWRGLVEGAGQALNGEYPYSGARRWGDTVELEPGDGARVAVPLGVYRGLVAGLDAGVRGFVGRARGWLARHAAAEDAGVIGDRLAAHWGVGS